MNTTIRMRQTMLSVMVAAIVPLAMTFALVGCGGASSEPAAPAAEEQEAAPSGEISEQKEEASEEDAGAEAEEQEEARDEAVAAELGKTYSTEEYDITFVDAHWDAANGEGEWTYSKGDNITRNMLLAADAQVFVIRATVTNKATAAIKPSLNYKGAAVANGKYEYDVRALSESGTHDIAPLETADVLVYVEVPPALKDQFENIDVKWGFTADDTYPQSIDDVYEVYELYFEQ